MNDIYEKIVSIIEDVTDIQKEDIEGESSLISDLDLASIEIMSVVAKIEKEYSVKITEEQLLSVETVNDLVEIISGGADLG